MRKTNLRTVEDLMSVNAVDLTEREIAKDERCLVKCHVCNNDTSEQLWQALRSSLRDHGFAWRCSSCFSKWCKEERPRKKVEPKERSSEELAKLGLVDTTPRPILQSDRVLAFCTVHPTDPKPTKDVIYNNLVGSYRRCGVAWRCPDCVKSKLSQVATEKTGDKNPFYGKTHSSKTKEHLSVTSKEWSQTEKGREHAARFGEMVKSRPNAMTIPEYRQAQWEATHTPEFIKQATERFNGISKREDIKKARSEQLRQRMKDHPDVFATSRAKGVQNAALPAAREKAANTIRKNQGFKSIWDKVYETMIKQYGVAHAMQVPEFRARSLSNSKRKGATEVLSKILNRHGFEVKSDVTFEGFNKSWDAVVYEKGKPIVAIDGDGQYFHGGVDRDPNGPAANFFNDPFRGQHVPDGVHYFYIDATQIEHVVSVVRTILSHSVEFWYNEMFANCWGTPFPYPQSTDSWLLKSWLGLKKEYCDSYKLKMAANALVVTFHPSIYHARVRGLPSPVEAWSNAKLLKKCIVNRYIYLDLWKISSYHVARGFEANRLAPRVSVFQPTLARKLLADFAPADAKTVVDPFAGYSGRMLGALSFGLSYTGYDINGVTLNESKRLLAFLQESATLICANSLTVNDPFDYDVLLTCPPYGDKERWGDRINDFETTDEYVSACLNNFKAKIYIFVVDDTEKYKDHVVRVLKNKSHLGETTERVLVFCRELPT